MLLEHSASDLIESKDWATNTKKGPFLRACLAIIDLFVLPIWRQVCVFVMNWPNVNRYTDWLLFSLSFSLYFFAAQSESNYWWVWRRLRKAIMGEVLLLHNSAEPVFVCVWAITIEIVCKGAECAHHCGHLKSTFFPFLPYSQNRIMFVPVKGIFGTQHTTTIWEMANCCVLCANDQYVSRSILHSGCVELRQEFRERR